MTPEKEQYDMFADRQCPLYLPVLTEAGALQTLIVKEVKGDRITVASKFDGEFILHREAARRIFSGQSKNHLTIEILVAAREVLQDYLASLGNFKAPAPTPTVPVASPIIFDTTAF